MSVKYNIYARLFPEAAKKAAESVGPMQPTSPTNPNPQMVGNPAPNTPFAGATPRNPLDHLFYPNIETQAPAPNSVEPGGQGQFPPMPMDTALGGGGGDPRGYSPPPATGLIQGGGGTGSPQLQQLAPQMQAPTGIEPMAGYQPTSSIRPADPKAIARNVPPEDAQGALKYWNDMYNNPVNQDKGWKGLVRELAENFLHGMSKAQPGMSMTDALALGATGAGAGFFNKGWNEQRRAEQEIPRAQQRVEFENQQQTREAQIANQQNQIVNRDRQTALDMEEGIQKRLSAEQNQLIGIWKDVDDFDPEANPQHKQIADQAAQMGVVLPAKRKGERFSTQIAPDGRIVITNTATGQYEIGGENLGRPRIYKDEDIPDAIFGLKSDDDIKTEAMASVGIGGPNRRVRPEVVAALPDAFKNPDGSFNEAAYMQALNRGTTEIKPSDLYENVPDNYKQRLAEAEKKLRSGQGGLRKYVSRFRSVINNRNPNPNGQAISLDEVQTAFKEVLAKGKPKDVEEFFTYLRNANIR